MTTLKVIGVKQMQDRFRELSESVQRTVLLEAVGEGADIVLEDARDRAPRDTGDLAEGMGKAEGITEPTRAAWDVGPDREQFYGRHVELGTVKSSKQPYLRPALDQNEDQVERTIARAVWNELRKR